jgi:hypothetical protein
LKAKGRFEPQRAGQRRCEPEESMSTTTESLVQSTKFVVNPRDGRRRKMRVVRPADDSGLVWLNCLTTNALICCESDPDTGNLLSPADAGDFGAPAPEDCRTYIPEES